MGRAITAMVLGIVSLVIPLVGLITAPLAIIFAAAALRNKEPGRGMAQTGLVTGIVAASGYTLWLLWGLFVGTGWLV